MSTEYGYCIQTNLLINHESLCISSQQNLQTSNFKLQTPLMVYKGRDSISLFK